VIVVAMTLEEALEVIAQHRGERIVVSTMASIGVWPRLSDTPLDFAYMPSAMGQAPALGLGLALAQPDRGVIVLNGDGSMLMNLGSLVTLANHPANICLVIMDNGIYEVTGGQRTAGTGHTNFAQMAGAAGIDPARVYWIDDVELWRKMAPQALLGPGPAVVWLHLHGRLGQRTPTAPTTMMEQIKKLRDALGV
jgi:thiamine pyrophosphate-dependent acetolactate synthase large subunit-like protein